MPRSRHKLDIPRDPCRTPLDRPIREWCEPCRLEGYHRIYHSRKEWPLPLAHPLKQLQLKQPLAEALAQAKALFQWLVDGGRLCTFYQPRPDLPGWFAEHRESWDRALAKARAKAESKGDYADLCSLLRAGYRDPQYVARSEPVSNNGRVGPSDDAEDDAAVSGALYWLSAWLPSLHRADIGFPVPPPSKSLIDPTAHPPDPEGRLTTHRILQRHIWQERPWAQCRICLAPAGATYALCEACVTEFANGDPRPATWPEWLKELNRGRTEAKREADADKAAGLTSFDDTESQATDARPDPDTDWHYGEEDTGEPDETPNPIDSEANLARLYWASVAEGIRALEAAATPAQARILALKRQGFTTVEIQQELGYTSPGSVSNPLRRLAAKAASAGNGTDSYRSTDCCALCGRYLTQHDYNEYRYLCERCRQEKLPQTLTAWPDWILPHLRHEALERRYRCLTAGIRDMQPERRYGNGKPVKRLTLPWDPAPYPTPELNRQYRLAHRKEKSPKTESAEVS